MNMKPFKLLPASLLMMLACTKPPHIEYQPIQTPDPSMKVIRLFQRSRTGSYFEDLAKLKSGPTYGFFYNPTRVVREGIVFYTADDLVAFLKKAKAEQQFDAVLIMIGMPSIYTAADIQLRNAAIHACAKEGIKVVIQELGGPSIRLFLATPTVESPNP